MTRSHPYEAYEGTETWTLLDKAVEELIENNDLIEQTNRAHIVGFLCKALLGTETVEE